MGAEEERFRHGIRVHGREHRCTPSTRTHAHTHTALVTQTSRQADRQTSKQQTRSRGFDTPYLAVARRPENGKGWVSSNMRALR